MDTIKELYYGNIHPYERVRKTLNDSETELFGKLKDAWSELTCLNECENFIIGFRLGVQLMTEALQAD